MARIDLHLRTGKVVSTDGGITEATETLARRAGVEPEQVYAVALVVSNSVSTWGRKPNA